MKFNELFMSTLDVDVPKSTHALDELEALNPEISDERFRILGWGGRVATPLEQEAVIGRSNFLDDVYFDRGDRASQSVGRIVGPGGLSATGFMISPSLLITNHHVLPDEQQASECAIQFDYCYQLDGTEAQEVEFEFQPERFFQAMGQPLDFAVVAVSATDTSGHRKLSEFGYNRLIPVSGKVREAEFVTIVQHPDGRRRQVALRENRVIAAPSELPEIWYVADTAYGSSGAPVFNDSFQVAALHTSGRVKRDNGLYVLRNGERVDPSNAHGISEHDVVWENNRGTRISAICRHIKEYFQANNPLIKELWESIQSAENSTEVVTVSVDDAPQPFPPRSNTMKEQESILADEHQVHGSITIPLKLHISLTAGEIASTASKGEVTTDSFETETRRMRVPVIYDDLESRTGYDPSFLNLPDNEEVPLPEITSSGKRIASRLDDRTFELKYHKFSIVMHKRRRLALFTAANIDFRSERRRVNGRSPTRRQLTEIPDGYSEQWVTDERIPQSHQLPDLFFTEDRAAFHKGHLVRRDAICWGSSFEDIQKANGDTFHTTNCSPQVPDFNMSNLGRENWGDLESEIERHTRSEKAVVLSGPVLSDDDPEFQGLDHRRRRIRVKIPREYWKIIVCNGRRGLEIFGFVLKQDLRDVPMEMESRFPRRWSRHEESIDHIEELLNGWISLEWFRENA